jgi:hypothetical protein
VFKGLRKVRWVVRSEADVARQNPKTRIYIITFIFRRMFAIYSDLEVVTILNMSFMLWVDLDVPIFTPSDLGRTHLLYLSRADSDV